VIPLLPSVVVNQSTAVSLAGEVTPRLGDGVGRHSSIGVGVNGVWGGWTSSRNKQKLQSPINAIDTNDDNNASPKSSLPTTTTGVGLQIQRLLPTWHMIKIPFVGVLP
jgi:hypothetical protein